MTVPPLHTSDEGDAPVTPGVTHGPAITTGTSAAAGRKVDLKEVFARLTSPGSPR
jgi:hypothetical protein